MQNENSRIPLVLNGENSREKLREITVHLEEGIKNIFESGRYREYLDVMAKFHNYSLNNTLLIAMQKPDASLVAGFSAWKNKFGRSVKKGEKGIRILASSPYKVRREKVDPETNLPLTDEDGNSLFEEKTETAFRVVSVFDVSQTEGRELPSLGADELSGSVEHYEDFFNALVKISPVPVSFEDMADSTHGYFHRTEKRIALKKNMSELQTLKTLIHEISHAKLHDFPSDAFEKGNEEQPDRPKIEVEAESVAYTVCRHYGLDTSEYSFGYIAGWSSGKELSVLKGSLETISKAAGEIISSTDEAFREILKERHSGEEINTENNVFNAEKISPEEAAKDFILAKLNEAGIEVVQDREEFNRIKEQIDEVNITLEMLEEKSFPIQFNNKKEIGSLNASNIDTLTRSQSLYRNIILDSSNSQEFINNLVSLENNKTKLEGKDFLSALKKAFLLDDNKTSNYIHNKENNLELRLSNHCANAEDAKRYEKSTSIVIKLVRGKNAPKFRKSREADVIEFAYYPENLTLESEKAIVNGLIDWVKTGEYTYTQADEIHQSVRKDYFNLKRTNIQTYTASDGTTYGFVYDGKIYLNPDIFTAETAMHEYTHLWDAVVQKSNPELWERGKSVMSKTSLWSDVKNDAAYADIADDDDLVMSECHARIVGKAASEILKSIAERDGQLAADAVIDWAAEVDAYIAREFAGLESAERETVSNLLKAPLKSLMEGDNSMNEEYRELAEKVIPPKVQATYYIRDTSEFDLFSEVEPITGLTADEAVKKYIELNNEGKSVGIGIYIKDDIVFGWGEGKGAEIISKINGKDSFYMGESFVEDLSEYDGHAQNVLDAFHALAKAAKNNGLDVDSSFIDEKHAELAPRLLQESFTWEEIADGAASELPEEQTRWLSAKNNAKEAVRRMMAEEGLPDIDEQADRDGVSWEDIAGEYSARKNLVFNRDGDVRVRTPEEQEEIDYGDPVMDTLQDELGDIMTESEIYTAWDEWNELMDERDGVSRIQEEELEEEYNTQEYNALYSVPYENKDFEEQYISGRDSEFRNILLARMKQDCEYYLGYAGRSPGSLWAKDETTHIKDMISLCRSFGKDSPQKWITWEELENFSKEMTGKSLSEIMSESIAENAEELAEKVTWDMLSPEQKAITIESFITNGEEGLYTAWDEYREERNISDEIPTEEFTADYIRESGEDFSDEYYTDPKYGLWETLRERAEAKKITFSIYQVKEGSEFRGIRFQGLSDRKNSSVPSPDEYDKVYEGNFVRSEKEIPVVCEKIFSRFNREDRPEDFRGRAVAVSDIILFEFEDNGKKEKIACYCDPIGFISSIDDERLRNFAALAGEKSIAERLPENKIEFEQGNQFSNIKTIQEEKTMEKEAAGLNQDNPFSQSVSDRQWNGYYVPNHNAKVLRESLENGTAPFLPDADGKIKTGAVINANTGYCLNAKDLLPFSVVNPDAEVAITYNSANKLGTRIKEGEKGFFYNFKREDGTYGTSQYYSPEQTENPSLVMSSVKAKTVSRADGKTLEITGADPKEYLASYVAACRNGATLKVNQSVAEEFRTSAIQLLKEQSAGKENYTKFMFDVDTRAGEICKSMANEIKNERKKSVEHKKEKSQAYA